MLVKLTPSNYLKYDAVYRDKPSAVAKRTIVSIKWQTILNRNNSLI
jgi:hypothetical protein